MIVVDTNIIAYLYISGEYSEDSAQLLVRDQQWCSPRLWRSELRNVLSLYLRKAILSFEDVLLIMQQAESLLRNREYEISSAEVLRLVETSKCSAYDCEFIALANDLGTRLVTSDKKILKEFPEVAIKMSDFLNR